MNEPTQRYPLLIVPQLPPSAMAAPPRSEDGDDGDDRADTAARVPYLHILSDGDEDLIDDDDDDMDEDGGLMDDLPDEDDLPDDLDSDD